jgi:hypothetical protein
MRINRTFLVLITSSILLIGLAYACARKSQAYAIEKDRELAAQEGFHISDIPQDWNYWDAGAISGFILGSASLVAAIWVVRGR